MQNIQSQVNVHFRIGAERTQHGDDVIEGDELLLGLATLLCCATDERLESVRRFTATLLVAIARPVKANKTFFQLKHTQLGHLIVGQQLYGTTAEWS